MPYVHFRPLIPPTHRGLKLAVISVAIGVKGVGYARGETSSSTESALRLITERMHVPLTVFGLLMVALALFGVVTAYSRYDRDAWGYYALVGFCVGWAACFAFGALFLGAPGYAWQGAINSLVFGSFLLLCAADPNTSDDA